MSDLTRRAACYGIGTGSVVALAGCTEAGGPATGRDGSDGTDGSGTDGNGTDGGDGDDDDDGGDEHSFVVQQTGAALSGASWKRTERLGFCALFTADDDPSWLLAEAPEEAEEFVAETDFAESVLCYVESVGPNTCYDEITFDGAGVEDGTFVADATVLGPGDDDVACGEAITYSGAFVRVTGGPLPDAARLSITDGWGETGTLRSDDGILDPERLRGGIRPDGEPSSLPASFDCDADGFERHPQLYEGGVNWGSGGGIGSDGDGDDGSLALRVVTDFGDATGDEPTDAAGSGGDGDADDLTVARGDRFRIELTNVSGDAASVGSRAKYNLELRTEGGWTELRGTDGDPGVGYNDLAIAVPPGGTLEWEFEMTETGLVEDGPRADAFRVCPDLVPGRYRFVFFGADDLAVAFDYEG
ncbi:hypothetical protein ABNG02_02780 [Halorubrum ejinorense]